ncbi:putative D-cysteine desulfhydrase 2, mitochondrial isoform X2 [Elaeis guineensis]|uniref:putative D-cysteine desulfhydrase 2, mitochondrial isoform X2 n=1 Tax=Elaeis guineensis var. tenera TaxID=51953 RepID=UPI003C6D03A1
MLCRLAPRPLSAQLHIHRRRDPVSSLSASLLEREWMLPSPATPIHKISLSKPHQSQLSHGLTPSQVSYSNEPRPALGAEAIGAREQTPSFFMVRDDLLHPLVNGNKARKLDALLPILQQYSATDIVTCGGCQSAHTAAVAVCCAERGIRSHLLLRGEQPDVPTGYNLISLMYGRTSYIARPLYARRKELLLQHASEVAGGKGSIVWVDDILGKDRYNSNLEGACVGHLDGFGSSINQGEVEEGSRRVVIVNEGADSVAGLLGVMRLVRYLSQTHLFGAKQQIRIVVDAGTGTTAVGLALGVTLLGLPWKVTAVMLADPIERYKERERCLTSNFKRFVPVKFSETSTDGVGDGTLQWVERTHPRKFGKVWEGEIEACRQIAQQTGILVDPVYTLAAWEQAVLHSLEEIEKDVKVVMLHTGGTLGMFGLAQRYKPYFITSEQLTVHSLP